ncbi:MAG: class I SAM-dependent methyltransferase [Saprospiraceae bacterium]
MWAKNFKTHYIFATSKLHANMNYKLLFPTYRNRYRFIRDCLQAFGEQRSFGRVLNLGTGEGDYDAMIAPYGKKLMACDINAQDIAFAKKLNADLSNVTYQLEDALQLSFNADSFDLITSIDVLEHVGQPAQMITEIGRVLRTGGLVFITFPYFNYPFTYDPINKIAGFFQPKRLIAQGAYAFGHEYLIKKTDFQKWVNDSGLEILSEQPLSSYLVALSEMYWTGIIQSLFKANASNVSEERATQKGKLRPSRNTPKLVKLTDGFINLDRAIFKNSAASVGRGFVLRKR